MGKRPKTYPVQIWFLDEDLQKSAQCLSNGLLYKSIKGCMQALITARFYFIGIRSKKFYKHFFDKEHKLETMDKFFPLWPMEKQPLFSNYDTRQSKWCRKCLEHVEYVKKYLEILCLEHEFRFRKVSSASKFLDWLENDAPPLKIPRGNLKKIVLEWKTIDPKYRSKDIVAGYRAQCKALLQNDGIQVKDFTNRDIPEFLLDESQKDEGMKKWMD